MNNVCYLHEGCLGSGASVADQQYLVSFSQLFKNGAVPAKESAEDPDVTRALVRYCAIWLRIGLIICARRNLIRTCLVYLLRCAMRCPAADEYAVLQIRQLRHSVNEEHVRSEAPLTGPGTK